MGLQNLLDSEIIVPVLMGVGLIHYIDSCHYRFFKDKLSFSKEDFEDAQFWKEYMDKTSSKESSEYARQNAIKKYKSFADKSVPKFFLFSRPFFYLQAKKELSYMKEESERRLNELKVA